MATTQQHVFVSTMAEFTTSLDQWLQGTHEVYALFSADWCPDCTAAAPHVIKAYQSLKKNTVLIQVDMGDRTVWRNPENPFRVDSKLHLTCVPTLINMKS
eukprot:Ihof_evm4s11 gene=Ihof_evmTU4s11